MLEYHISLFYKIPHDRTLLYMESKKVRQFEITNKS
jgi:hypothetical protein